MNQKVVIIGLGNATWKYAEDEPGRRYITHTWSLIEFPSIEIVAGIDLDPKTRLDWS
jgi:hypothetical protein